MNIYIYILLDFYLKNKNIFMGFYTRLVPPFFMTLLIYIYNIIIYKDVNLIVSPGLTWKLYTRPISRGFTAVRIDAIEVH